MNGSRRGPTHWHLDVGGRRTGPHDWGVILELAQFGMLNSSSRLWCPEFPGWRPVSDFPELMNALLGLGSNPANRRLRRDMREAARALPAIAIGLLWATLSLVAIALTLVYFPDLQDGVLAARLQILTPLILLSVGIWSLCYVWPATVPGGTSGGSRLRVTVRVSMAIAAFCLLLVILTTIINSRELFPIAWGRDPLGTAELRVLAGGTELEIRGMLGTGTTLRVAKMLTAERRIRVIRLDSPGGRVGEGTQLAALIRVHKLGTYSATGCYSACVLAFIAGSPRVLDPEARLGLHSTSGDGTDPFLISLLNEDYQESLRRAGASEQFVTRATLASPDELWMPEPEELLSNHLVDRVSSDEFAPAGAKKAAR